MRQYFTTDKTQIFQGDCLEVMDIFINEEKKIDFIFTSPPYNRKQNDKYTHYEDNKKNYLEFLIEFTNKALKLARYVFVNIQPNISNRKDVHKYIGEFGEFLINNIIWQKSNPQPPNTIHSITNSYEYILVFSIREKTLKSKRKGVKNIITTATNSQNKYSNLHGAVMHPVIAKWFIDSFTSKEDLIMDPFLGTGTTCYYSEEAGRNSIGIELSEEYCSLAVARFKELQIKLDI